jgi:DNA-binding beta-propeller fold protein YncE
VALVTAERQNQLIAVELSTGRTLRRVTVPADPQNVAALAGRSHTVIVVSTRAGAVTLLDWKTLKTVKVFHALASPHLAAISPFGKWAYVTDDGRGEFVVIALGTRRIVDRVFVGAGAHHLTISPGGRRAWVALGEHASEIAIVDLTRPAWPRLLRRFSPGFVAHDLTFSPDGAPRLGDLRRGRFRARAECPFRTAGLRRPRRGGPAARRFLRATPRLRVCVRNKRL